MRQQEIRVNWDLKSMTRLAIMNSVLDQKAMHQ